MPVTSSSCRARWPVLALVLLLLVPGHAAKWDPVNPADLALAAPRVEKDADAEALLWEITVRDIARGGLPETVYDHFLRVKLFTDRGRDAQSRVDLMHGLGVRVYDVEGRTIRRDGTTVELKQSDVFQRDILRAGGIKVKATSFVLPGAETGGLLEYRWRETHEDSLSHNLRLPFGRDIPIHLVKYHIQPLATIGTEYVMRAFPFHCTPTELVQVGAGTFFTSLSNVPALREEPRAPSEWELRPWLFLYYDERASKNSPQQFWSEWSRDVARSVRRETSPTGAVKRAAASLTPADNSVDATIAAILEYLRTRITRMDLDTTSEAQRKGFKANKNLDEALQKGQGRAMDVRMLFVALARARSLDARIVQSPSRDDMRINPEWMLPQLFKEVFVAVRSGDAWRFVDPANTYSSAGALRWTQEGLQVLIPDEKELIIADTPASPPAANVRSRKARLTLLEDGTLEGEVTGEVTGHSGLAFKEDEDGLADAERAKTVEDSVLSRLPGAEVTHVRVEHVTSSDKPYTYTYRLRVPGYTQRAGSRIFIQPAILQKGLAPEFGADQRTHPVAFRYAWQEVDEISIHLPEGFQADLAGMPTALEAGQVASHRITMTTDGAVLQLRRELTFGNGGRLLFEPSMYNAIKRFFDEVARRDAITVTLRKAAGGLMP